MGKTYIKRPTYLEQLVRLKDKDLIKVITGIRRSGKSTLLELFGKELVKGGVKKEQIIAINLEHGDFNQLRTSSDLYEYVESKITDRRRKYYVFIDEVQQIPNFQRACDNLYVEKNVDLYITGSNASLLSGELATLLSGRYVEIKMMPLSFKEYVSRVGRENLVEKYHEYTTIGSFPYLLELDNEMDRKAYLEGIYNTIVVKDIAERRGITNISQLGAVIRFMFDNIGNESSSTTIANALKRTNHTVSVPTVDNYLRYLTEAFIFYRADRYDIKGKKLLENSPKYYAADLGLRQYLLGGGSPDYGRVLENVVYLELLRRGYDVRVGRSGQGEVDFVAKNGDGVTYFQVAYSAVEEATLERELASLRRVGGDCSRVLLTMDQVATANYEGILHRNVIDWLLEG